MKGYNIERFRNGYLVIRSNYVETLGGGAAGGGGNLPKEAFFFKDHAALGLWLAEDMGGAIGFSLSSGLPPGTHISWTG